VKRRWQEETAGGDRVGEALGPMGPRNGGSNPIKIT
jgi:hypothetical protein